MVEDTKSGVLRDAQLPDPERPEEELPQLPVELAEITDEQLMSLFARFTRWADYMSLLVALDEVHEKFAEDKVTKLERLFMLGNRPEKPQDGYVTMVRAAMEENAEIVACREAAQIAYAHRKLMQTFFESAERDAAVLSRELTRRTGMETYSRRLDRMKP